jgi:uncharacterized protein (TIGR03067 family)
VKWALLAAILSGASVAAAASETFGVYLVTTAGAPGARLWTLPSAGGAVETISLDSVALLDASGIATADREPSPGGGSQIRLVLTSDGARTLAAVTSRNVGRRFGIVVDGRLRAAPFVSGGLTDGVLVVGGLDPGEAAALARKLGPPPASVSPGFMTPRDTTLDAAAFRVLEGTWTLRSATVNGQPIPDPKFAGARWIFRDGTLAATDGLGQTERFTLRTDADAPGALHFEPVAPSKERGGWLLFKREEERLTVAAFDGLSSRPENFEPAPKKLILTFSR